MKILVLLCLVSTVVSGQILTGLSARWDDDPTEWIIYTAEPEQEGELLLRWKHPLRWSDWDFQIGEKRGTIEAKWKDRLDEWTIRFNDETVTARAMWQNDFSEWTLTDNANRIIFRTKWNNNPEVWTVRDTTLGRFEVYTTWEGDMRDWSVYDDLDEEVSISMKMAMMFIALLPNLPLR